MAKVSIVSFLGFVAGWSDVSGVSDIILERRTANGLRILSRDQPVKKKKEKNGSVSPYKER